MRRGESILNAMAVVCAGLCAASGCGGDQPQTGGGLNSAFGVATTGFAASATDAPGGSTQTTGVAPGDGGAAVASGCGATQYEAASGQCAELTVCPSGSFESAPPTATSNRECAPLTQCGPEEHESVAPTATSDRECSPLTQCEAGQYVSLAASATADRECAPCPEGTFSDAPNQPECRPWTACGEGEQELEAGSASTDRECGPCGGTIQAAVSFAGAAQLLPELHDDITRCIEAALDMWAERLVAPRDVTIEFRIDAPDIPTASGASLAQPRLPNQEGRTVYEAGVAYEIRTGEDPNDSSADAVINLGVRNLDGLFWFDPDPWERTAALPSGTVDATSVCLHEVGHVLGFNGYIDAGSWRLPSGYATNYDLRSIPDGDAIYFVGPLSEDAYGARVPETSNSPVHLGNLYGPGADLDADVMHGTPTRADYRYEVSETDWAILADLGMPVVGTDAARDNCDASAQARVVRPAPELGPPVPVRP